MIVKQILRIISFRRPKLIHWLVIFILFFGMSIPAIMNDPGNSNAYAFLSKSLCRGHLFLSPSDLNYVKGTNVLDNGDLIFFHNKYYLPYPPAPAILLIPFVLLTGGFVNGVLVAVLLSCLNLVLLYKILLKNGVDEKYISWVIYGFIFGTGYWYVLLTSHHVYGFAEIVSVTGVLLLFNELFGKSRAFLMGIYLGIAFLSRQFTVLIALFVVGYFINTFLISSMEKKTRWFIRKMFFFSLSLGFCILLYFIYNYARFGNIFDTGYKNIVFIGTLKERVDQYGVFSSHYVLYNLYSYLFKGFNIEFTGNGLLHVKDVDLYGSALFVASPFLIASFKSGWTKILRSFAWVTIGLIFIGLLFYHNNGKDQVNTCRFTLDFLPLMLILVGLGAKNIPQWLFKGMVSYSILLNIIALGVHLFFHTLK